MLFLIISLFFIWAGRRLGWKLSRDVLFESTAKWIVLLSAFWGATVASAVYCMIAWLAPNIIIKIIFGYMAGAYVSIPNYGLNRGLYELAKGIKTQNDFLLKNELITLSPFLIYVLASIVIAWSNNKAILFLVQEVIILALAIYFLGVGVRSLYETWNEVREIFGPKNKEISDNANSDQKAIYSRIQSPGRGTCVFGKTSAASGPRP